MMIRKPYATNNDKVSMRRFVAEKVARPAKRGEESCKAQAYPQRRNESRKRPLPEHEGGTLIMAKAQGRLSGRRMSEE
jgi:hypothetical protein